MAWLDGRPASQLFKLLDDLRVKRLYPLSIALLEYAWNSDLPDDRLGRVAEDWIGRSCSVSVIDVVVKRLRAHH